MGAAALPQERSAGFRVSQMLSDYDGRVLRDEPPSVAARSYGICAGTIHPAVE
jgi:hypothetical protein